MKKKENTSKDINQEHTFRGVVDSWDGSVIKGWASHTDTDTVELSILVDNEEVIVFSPNQYRNDLKEAGVSITGQSGFQVELSTHKLFDAKKSEVRIVEKNSKLDLTGGFFLISPPMIKGHIDKYSADHIVGWLYDHSMPNLCVKIDVYVNGILTTEASSDIVRHDLKEAGIENFVSGFHINLAQYIDQLKLNVVSFKLAGTNISILNEINILPNSARVNALIKLQNVVKDRVFDQQDNELNWLVQTVIPSLIDKTRNRTFAQEDFNISLNSYSSKTEPVVDIIIPVYKGFEETVNCINSVFEVDCDQAFNVIVINDCSPEPELTEELRALSSQLSFTLIENEVNLGFVGTVNRGMRLNSENDVLLLNSDTIVTNNWLSKITSAAYSKPTIGTVTPFSNNATICSYPRFCVDNELPTLVTLNELSAVFAKENKAGIVDLPTAHGFSMFIKRATLNEVGFFDEQKWGKGYAEENDFSLRAARLGWRNVMATDAFVHHLGSVSFAGNTDEFIATNLRKLNGIYPDYPQAVQSFINADPIRPYRNNVALALMKKEIKDLSLNSKGNYKGSILFVSLTIGGGTQVATDDLAEIHRNNEQSVFMLTTPKNGLWELRSQVDNTVIQYQWPEDKTALIDDLKSLSIESLHYHHTIEFNGDVWGIPKELNVPYDITLHDYYTLCPRANLVDDTQSYCGEPKSDACNRCIKKNGVHPSSLLSFDDLGGDINSWRAYFLDKLKGARKVITPSHDTRERVLNYFNLDNIEAIYHPESEIDYQPLSLDRVEVINIMFLGAIGIHKGFNVLKECAEYAYKFDLPIKFTVIGYTADDEYFKSLPNVTITGKYKKEELPELIKKHDCHIAGLFSVWPETFSYTLSEALRANLKIAAFKIGAVNERCTIDYMSDIGDSPSSIVNKLLGVK
ncbi:glycosyltransferase [Psychromonas sp.]|uniref:glycosyltransferase n=1 Tax=Psychromonas sp. TaxID=1884585 RepID=UPI003A981929